MFRVNSVRIDYEVNFTQRLIWVSNHKQTRVYDYCNTAAGHSSGALHGGVKVDPAEVGHEVLLFGIGLLAFGFNLVLILALLLGIEGPVQRHSADLRKGIGADVGLPPAATSV